MAPIEVVDFDGGFFLETVNGFRFRRFFENFWQIFFSFVGGNKGDENLPKILKKATKPKSVNSLLSQSFF